MRNKNTYVRNAGVTTLLVIGFMGVFMLILGTISSFALQQGKYGRVLYDREQALHSAESGLEYYRWFLAHNPGNLTNGTGLAGPYSYTLSDPESGTIGTASLSIAGTMQCGQVQWIDITSVGKSNLNPSFPRTLFGRYMRQSVAAYSYLLNSNVWAGATRNITGPYFSNGGIRMDGTNNSDVNSAVATWSCDSSYGCSPTQTQPGVFGAGTGSALWHNSVTSIDFAGIAANFTTLKGYAQNNGGRYVAAASGSASSRGYHVIFKSDGTYDLYRVTSTTAVPSYTSEDGWFSSPEIIATQTLVGNYSIPASCSLIFIEDRVWVEGVIPTKVTLVAATPTDTGTTPDIFLLNNITYTTNTGTAGLTLMAEGDVLIPLNSPDTMEIHGIFVAQGGRYGRNFYTNDNSYPSADRVGATWASYVLRNQLTTNGSVVSSLRTGTSWTSSGTVVSGYQTRIDAYDELQATNPPPFTPAASTDYGYVIWREN